MGDSTESWPEGTPQKGEVLEGKYRVESVLGKGGMGVVLGARHEHLDQSVAIKLLLPEAAKSKVASARFFREAKAAAAIKSDHVVRVLDVGTLANGAPFMVMELLEGEDLAQLVRRAGALPPSLAVNYVLEACEALSMAHAAGIVHRDLKPSNLFLAKTPTGEHVIKVLDFGISKATTGEMGNEAALTATQATLGSPLYMSPEQVKCARDVDHRTDIWSLGVVLFELLSAQVPFRAPTVSALCVKIAVEAPQALSALAPELPAPLVAAVMRCLEKEPEARFADISAFAKAISPYGREPAKSLSRIMRAGQPKADPDNGTLGDGPISRAITSERFGGNTHVDATRSIAERGDKKLGIAVPAAVALALLAGVGGWAASRDRATPQPAQQPSSTPAATTSSPPSSSTAPSNSTPPSTSTASPQPAASPSTTAPTAPSSASAAPATGPAGAGQPPGPVKAGPLVKPGTRPGTAPGGGFAAKPD